MKDERKFVTVLRLDSGHGYHHMGDAMEVSGWLQSQGIDAIAEMSPTYTDSVFIFNIKVPVEQLQEAREKLKIYNTARLVK